MPWIFKVDNFRSSLRRNCNFSKFSYMVWKKLAMNALYNRSNCLLIWVAEHYFDNTWRWLNPSHPLPPQFFVSKKNRGKLKTYQAGGARGELSEVFLCIERKGDFQEGNLSIMLNFNKLRCEVRGSSALNELSPHIFQVHFFPFHG